MLPTWFLIIAILLRLLAGGSYLRAVIRGHARPNPLTWLLWGVAPSIAFAAEISAGAGPAAFVTLALGLSPLLVFTAAMVKNPRSLKFDRFNTACAVISAFALGGWLVTAEPLVAIFLAIIADFIAGLPTFIKALRRPETEYAPSFMLSASAMIIALLTIGAGTAAIYTFYALTINIWIASVILRGNRRAARRKKPRHRSAPRRRYV